MPPRSPSVIAYHLIWTAYGTWLPNDPRGSGSHAVATPELAELGELHYGRRRRQPSPQVVRDFYDRAEPRLLYSVLRFNQQQIDSIAAAFAAVIQEHRYTCYACAIMHDHMHFVIRKHKHRAETMIDNLQDASRWRLAGENHAWIDHPIWTEGGWKGFLDSPSTVRTVIRYVENNPIKAGLPAQHCKFAVPYDGWPHHKCPPTDG